jgi:hypothetical protein
MSKGQGKVRKLGLIITGDLFRTGSEDIADKGIAGHRFTATLPAFSLKQYATPIKDQGNCGSCVAFGSCATLETTLNFAAQSPGGKVDESEADLFSNGGSCANGWQLEKANSVLQSKGVCIEACWPYQGDKQPCADANPRHKILSVTRITSDAAAKAAIASGHAVQFAMDVDSDYFDVDSEKVYEPEYGDYAGGHCQSIIGYDDSKSAWLVKNSWGTTWGFGGYAWVKYGVCGIFRDYAGYTYEVTTTPGPGPDPNPVPTGDITLPTSGKLSVMPIVGKNTLDLVIVEAGNGTGIFSLSKMKSYRYSSLGIYPAGGLTIQLGDPESGNVYHSVLVKPAGNNLWLVWMRTTKSGSYNYAFQFKFVAATEPKPIHTAD